MPWPPKTLVDTEDDNASGEEFEDTPELLNDDDDFFGMMDVDVPSSKKPQTLSEYLIKG